MITEIKNILIIGGGTGGHIAPAIAVGKALHKEYNYNVSYVCGDKEIEKVFYNKEGISPTILSLPKFKAINPKFYINLFKAVLNAAKIIKEKKIHAVFGAGGYTCAAVMTAAVLMRKPLFIQEQNSLPGKVNKLFGRFAKKIFLGLKQASEYFNQNKIFVTGNPITYSNFNIDRKEACDYFKLNSDKKIILIIGGSQGASGINDAVLEMIEKNQTDKSFLSDMQILWSAGKSSYDQIISRLKDNKYCDENVRVLAMIDRMDYAYAISEIAVSRAGALSLSELSAFGCPSILIPYPYAAENHQLYNAKAYTLSGGAILIENKNFSAGKLFEELKTLFDNPSRLKEMKYNIKTLAKTDASDKIAHEIFKSISN